MLVNLNATIPRPDPIARWGASYCSALRRFQRVFQQRELNSAPLAARMDIRECVVANA
jgi:hypothetical protein